MPIRKTNDETNNYSQPQLQKKFTLHIYQKTINHINLNKNFIPTIKNTISITQIHGYFTLISMDLKKYSTF